MKNWSASIRKWKIKNRKKASDGGLEPDWLEELVPGTEVHKGNNVLLVAVVALLLYMLLVESEVITDFCNNNLSEHFQESLGK